MKHKITWFHISYLPFDVSKSCVALFIHLRVHTGDIVRRILVEGVPARAAYMSMPMEPVNQKIVCS